MLGDTAVAVNSGDERYRHLHGKRVLLPLMNREIPIITDDILANPEFGTGAVKVTPSHDPNDFEAGLRNNLPQIEVMNEIAQMNENAGPYQGLDRFEARQKVLEDLEARRLPGRREGLRGAARQVRPLQDHHRAAPVDAVVREDPAAGRPRHRSGGAGRDQVRSRELHQDLFRVDAQHPRLVHLAPVVVGTSHSRVALQGLRRDHRRARGAGEVHQVRRPAGAGHRRARHLVLVGTAAVLGAGLARQHARPRRLLSDDAADHRLRHPVLLGGAHDHDELPLHARPQAGRRAVPHRLHPRPGARCRSARRCRRPRAT